MKKYILIPLLILVAIIVAGMYKFNYLANQPGYDADGNKEVTYVNELDNIAQNTGIDISGAEFIIPFPGTDTVVSIPAQENSHPFEQIIETVTDTGVVSIDKNIPVVVSKVSSNGEYFVIPVIFESSSREKSTYTYLFDTSSENGVYTGLGYQYIGDNIEIIEITDEIQMVNVKYRENDVIKERRVVVTDSDPYLQAEEYANGNQ